MTSTPRNVAAYVRLSVATEESVSVAGQVRMVQAEAARRGWPEPRIFTDDGVSGSKAIARPARDDLEARIGAGEFDALLVKSVDRLARSVLDFHRIAQSAKVAGCALVVIEAGLDSSTPSGAMMLGILAQFAEFEAATIGARVTTSNVTRRASGRALGGPVPYGLQNVDTDRGMVRAVNPTEAVVVRRMVDEILAGATLRSVALGLQRDGVPTPRESSTSPWAYTAVRRILNNPALAGQTRALGDVVRDVDGLPHVDPETAILDGDTWRRLQDAMGERKASTASLRRTPHADRPLLDGLALCDACGGPLRRVATRGYVSYSCSRGGATVGGCPSRVTISASRLDPYVVSEFLDALGDTPRTRLEQTDDERVSARVATLRAEVTDTVAALGTAPSSEIGGLAERLTSLRDAEARLLAEAGAAPVYAVVNTGQTWAETWATAPDVVARRALLSEALHRVRVGKPTVTGAAARYEAVEKRVHLDWQ